MCRPRVSIPPLAFEVVGQPRRSKGLGDTRAQNPPKNPKDTLRPIATHARPGSGPGRFTRSIGGHGVYLDHTWSGPHEACLTWSGAKGSKGLSSNVGGPYPAPTLLCA